MANFAPGGLKGVKNLILDVDGVMTDGRFYYTAEGKVMKAFGSDDADALSILRPRMNIVFVTGDKRGFPITKKRIEDMKFPVELVSTFERVNWLKERYDLAETVYMGDGIYESLVFNEVAYAIAPANAFPLAKQKADFVTKNAGGYGAVAEAVCHILERFFEPLDLEKLDFSGGSGGWTRAEQKTVIPQAISKLGVGPMSPEIIEAVFRYSEQNKTPLMLIASKNQIDWDGGYVNGWRTAEYMDYINFLKKKYPASQVKICRDHCGPGFKNDDMQDVYQTLDSDVALGFDLIHVDFCRFHGDYGDILRETENAINFVRKKNPDILIEVGTDDNVGEYLNDTNKAENELRFFTNITPVAFYVCQTGSLIKEVNQVGSFNHDFITRLNRVAAKYSVALKEHNADYMAAPDIATRRGLVGAMNVAPQFGTIQTMLVLKKAITYGLDISEFLDAAYASRRWEKWLHHNNESNKFLCSLIAGHYNFHSDAYKRLYEKISAYEDIREAIIMEAMKKIDLYVNNL